MPKSTDPHGDGLDIQAGARRGEACLALVWDPRAEPRRLGSRTRKGRHRLAGAGRRLSARWKSARIAGSIPAECILRETNPGASRSLVLLTLQAVQGLVTSRGSRIRVRREAHGMCIAIEGGEPCLATGDVAQLGEHLLCTQGVTGSSPVISTSTLSTE